MSSCLCFAWYVCTYVRMCCVSPVYRGFGDLFLVFFVFGLYFFVFCLVLLLFFMFLKRIGIKFLGCGVYCGV